MTQTIHDCAAIPAGKTYPVEHLRTAESIEQLCEYVNAGHPIAYFDGGGEVSFFRKRGQGFFFDFYYINTESLRENYHKDFLILDRIKLAPLAYRNGRPLHVGYEIEYLYMKRWNKTRMTMTSFDFYTKDCEWRFADEVAV